MNRGEFLPNAKDWAQVRRWRSSRRTAASEHKGSRSLGLSTGFASVPSGCILLDAASRSPLNHGRDEYVGTNQS